VIHLAFEQIGDDYFAYRRFGKHVNSRYERRKWQMTKESLRVWVKRVEPWGSREIAGIKDYSIATGAGSRGVMIHYFLSPGIYEVNERVSWQNARAYFIQVENSTYFEIDEPCQTINGI
jgi:hypothetical protein